MPILVLNDVITTTAYCQLGEQVSVTRFDHQVTAVTGAGATDAEVLAFMTGVLPAAMKAIMGGDSTYASTSVGVVRGAARFTTLFSIFGAGPGLMNALQLPGKSAVYFPSLRSLRGGPSEGDATSPSRVWPLARTGTPPPPRTSTRPDSWL